MVVVRRIRRGPLTPTRGRLGAESPEMAGEYSPGTEGPSTCMADV